MVLAALGGTSMTTIIREGIKKTNVFFFCGQTDYKIYIFYTFPNNIVNLSAKTLMKTLPEAQRTQGIESMTWIMFSN